MSDERFERWNDHCCKVKDNREYTFLNWEDVVQKLNEQQEHITHLEDTNDNFRIKLIEDIEAMEQAEKKIGEQQATISALKEENEQLKKECKIAIDEMVTDYKKLEKENAQLQKELESLGLVEDE